MIRHESARERAATLAGIFARPQDRSFWWPSILGINTALIAGAARWPGNQLWRSEFDSRLYQRLYPAENHRVGDLFAQRAFRAEDMNPDYGSVTREWYISSPTRDQGCRNLPRNGLVQSSMGAAYKEDSTGWFQLNTVGRIADPIFGQGIMEPPQDVGVENFGESQVT
jgi:hypothetical protein